MVIRITLFLSFTSSLSILVVLWNGCLVLFTSFVSKLSFFFVLITYSSESEKRLFANRIHYEYVKETAITPHDHYDLFANELVASFVFHRRLKLKHTICVGIKWYKHTKTFNLPSHPICNNTIYLSFSS